MTLPIHIALASDEKYFPGLLVTVTSVVASTDSEASLVFHVLDGGIRDDSFQWLVRCVKQYNSKCEFDRIPFTPDVFRQYRPLLGSLMPYARILLPDLLALDRVIYLDSDLLFFKDIQALWSMSHEGASVIAVQDQVHWLLKSDCPWIDKEDPAGDKPYFNSGVMYMDLSRWREGQVRERTLHLISQNPGLCTYADQTALNYVLVDKVHYIDLSWNRRPDKVCPENYDAWLDVNLHYLAVKPWLTYVNATNYAFWYRFHNVMCRRLRPAVLQYGLLVSCLKRTAMAKLAAFAWSRMLVERLLRIIGKSWDPLLHNGCQENSAAFGRIVRGWRAVRRQRRCRTIPLCGSSARTMSICTDGTRSGGGKSPDG